MQTITIRTTQNVSIEYLAAGLGDRVLAYILDSLIITAYMVMFLLFFAAIGGVDVWWAYVLIILPPFFYHLVAEVFFDGQSIGKHAIGIKVIRLDGAPVTLGNYIMRWMLRIVDISITSGGAAVICIAVTPNGQRLGDLAAGTTVVKLKKPTSSATHKIIQQMDEDYVPVFTQVANLSINDIELIREALKTYKSTANAKPIVAITDKLKDHLEIESDMPRVTLLHTILKDYSYLTSR